MAKTNNVSLFEHYQIVELHNEGLSQRAIAVILNFFKDPRGYKTKSQVVDPKTYHLS